MLQDKLLIIRFKRGSSEALRRIYEKYRLYLLKISAALLNDVAASEDVVHDVFVRFAKSADSLKVTGSLKAYLRTCVANAARNHSRAKLVRSSVTLDDVGEIAADSNRPDRWIILNEQSMQISNALASIPFEQRETIVLHLHGGAKFREIAVLQNVPVKTIQSRYRYGLDKLRSILSSEVQK